VASFSNVNDTAILNALFCAVFTGTWSTVAQNAAAPATNLYVSLHNADPGAAGSQTTNETAYTNYARQAVARTTGGWTVSSAPNQVINAATVTFATCGATGDTLTHWGLGLSLSGAGTLLASGPINTAGFPAVSFECTNASPGVLTCYGYTPAVNDRVACWALPGSQGLPTGITAGTVYYVGTAPGGQTLTLSTTTANGNPVNTSSTGQGMIFKCSPLVVSNNITPAIAAGAMIITAL
jgi:hypothetical protein